MMIGGIGKTLGSGGLRVVRGSEGGGEELRVMSYEWQGEVTGDE